MPSLTQAKEDIFKGNQSKLADALGNTFSISLTGDRVSMCEIDGAIALNERKGKQIDFDVISEESSTRNLIKQIIDDQVQFKKNHRRLVVAVPCHASTQVKSKILSDAQELISGPLQTAYPQGIAIIGESIAVALQYRLKNKTKLSLVPERNMLFINLGAKHSSATLACFTQTKRGREEELRYYGIDEPVVYDERSTEVLKTCHSLELNL